MNRCRTKFARFFGYKQFRCHSYLESCEAYCAEKRVPQQTRSPGNFASAFDVSYDFKGGGCVHKEDVQIMNSLVAEMIHRHLEWGSQLQLR